MTKCIILADMGFGDGGKGGLVSSLTNRHMATYNVRYCGGAQASHHVVRDDGTVHAFHQFGSGTFEGARTHLSRFHLFDPLALQDELKELKKHGLSEAIIERITVDEESPLVTLYHIMANQIEESARDSKHGSCGCGIWQTQRTSVEYPDAIPRMKHLSNRAELITRLAWLQELKKKEMKAGHPCLLFEDGGTSAQMRRKWEHLNTAPDIIADMMREIVPRIVDSGYLSDILRNDVTIFEGAQGILLDQDHGFAPYVTGTTTTFKNADTLLKEAGFTGDVNRIGVTRTYMTRHGAGPLPTERNGYGPKEKHNGTGEYQGAFRTGPLDIPLLKYAIKISGGIDSLAVTHVDADVNEVCLRYSNSSAQEFGDKIEVQMDADIEPCENIVGLLSSELKVPISIVSHGPMLNDKQFIMRYP